MSSPVIRVPTLRLVHEIDATHCVVLCQLYEQ